MEQKELIEKTIKESIELVVGWSVVTLTLYATILFVMEFTKW